MSKEDRYFYLYLKFFLYLQLINIHEETPFQFYLDKLKLILFWLLLYTIHQEYHLLFKYNLKFPQLIISQLHLFKSFFILLLIQVKYALPLHSWFLKRYFDDFSCSFFPNFIFILKLIIISQLIHLSNFRPLKLRFHIFFEGFRPKFFCRKINTHQKWV